MNGAWGAIDEAIDRLDEAIRRVLPDRETFGTDEAAERAQQAAEALFPDATTMPARPRRRRRPAASSGHPMEAGVVEAITAEEARRRVP